MTIACPDCGLIQDVPRPQRFSKVLCALCHGDLERRSGRSVSATLAVTLATFILLIPANLLPLIRMHIFIMHGENRIMGGIIMLWNRGWVLLAVIAGLLVVILPFVRLTLLGATLTCLRIGRRPAWLGPVFRWVLWLDTWAMIDVFLLASFVGYYRLAHVRQAHVSILPGGFCFIAAALLAMLGRAVLDRRAVWREIGGELPAPAERHLLSCTSCDLVLPAAMDGKRCPRCRAYVRTRKPDAMVRTTALLLAALIFFFPANIYPMNVSSQLGSRHHYTILRGIIDLFDSGLWPLGIIIFCTSFLIPLGKILFMLWCVLRVRFRWTSHLVGTTKIYRVVAEFGRWSKTDPYVIVFFVPLMNFGAFASSHAGWGATAFLMMTLVTMLASATFDPRLMWDVATPAERESVARRHRARSEDLRPVGAS